MQKTIWKVLLCALLCYTETAFGQSVPMPVVLTVRNQPAQTLAGFGCSMVDISASKIPAAARSEMFQEVFRDLQMNVLRLWVQIDADRTTAQMKAEFYSAYVNSGLIADAQKQGVTTLLLAPARGEERPRELMAVYARKLAEFISEIRAERGIRIQVTGIANEPGFTPDQMAEAVRLLRLELNTRHLSEVQIIGPESASADEAGLHLIQGIRADPGAWKALSGIATHSYNMAATPAFPALLAGTRKQYWMTEAADNGNEGEADVDRAASISARFLNDLNNGVTQWLYFIGCHESADVTTDNDNATKFMVYDLKQKRIVRNLKYDWFRQLRAVFPNGSRIYPLSAAPGGNLTYSYGLKPYLNAAAARRPDGGWSLGMVNLSGVTPDTDITQWHPATSLQITWKFAPLANRRTVLWTLFRSDAAHRFVPSGSMTMTNGSLSLTLHPGELVTLSCR